MSQVERAEEEIVARVGVLVGRMNPRDIDHARRGMHRRMYVNAAAMVDLIDAVERLYPGFIATCRDGAS